MQMVYAYWGMTFSQESIWNDICRFNRYSFFDCSPEKMVQHFHKNKFSCIFVATFSPLQPDLFFIAVQRLGLSAMINYTLGKNHHHFVVFEKVVDAGIIVQDPDSGEPNRFITFKDLAQPQIMLITRSSQRAKCPHCNEEFPSCDLFNELYGRHVARCAYCCEELCGVYAL